MSRQAQIDAVARGEHGDPFAVLGPHPSKDGWEVRTVQPQAASVEVVGLDGERLASMRRVHQDGVYEARVDGAQAPYRLAVEEGGARRVVEDPYRFASLLGEVDRYLLGEGPTGGCPRSSARALRRTRACAACTSPSGRRTRGG